MRMAVGQIKMIPMRINLKKEGGLASRKLKQLKISLMQKLRGKQQYYIFFYIYVANFKRNTITCVDNYDQYEFIS